MLYLKSHSIEFRTINKHFDQQFKPKVIDFYFPCVYKWYMAKEIPKLIQIA